MNQRPNHSARGNAGWTGIEAEGTMTPLSVLWLPIFLSGVVVFVVSSVVHMLLPWHKGDYKKLPHEAEVLDAIRPFELPPGDYMAPCPQSTKDLGSAEFKEKMNQGPVIVLTVLPSGPMAMGRNLMLWFLYSLVVGLFAAYVAGRALPPGTNYLHVFRFVGATAFIGYSVALWQMTIWYRRSWITTLKSTIDGLLYGLLTAGMFGWLWPR